MTRFLTFCLEPRHMLAAAGRQVDDCQSSNGVCQWPEISKQYCAKAADRCGKRDKTPIAAQKITTSKPSSHGAEEWSRVVFCALLLVLVWALCAPQQGWRRGIAPIDHTIPLVRRKIQSNLILYNIFSFNSVIRTSKRLAGGMERDVVLAEVNSTSCAANRSDNDIHILGISTSVPDNILTQDDAEQTAQKYFPHFNRRNHLFSNTGISQRYTVEPLAWYEQQHTWQERTASFHQHALALLEQVATNSIATAGLGFRDIDVIVTNTITGLAIPSLEARLINRCDFRPDVVRLPIFGLGCGGGVAGLCRAARMATAAPGETVLFLTVDLCSLCMRVNDPSLAMFVASALFGDGAAGVVLGARPPGDCPSASCGRIAATGEYFWRDTERIMGWDIMDDGFGVVLSPELPRLMETHLAGAVDQFLGRSGLKRSDIDGYLIHPGGAKVLETAAHVLNLQQHDLRLSWEVLQEYGNMSSATALFVLKRAIEHQVKGRHLLAAFGPGFSAYFAVVDL